MSAISDYEWKYDYLDRVILVDNYKEYSILNWKTEKGEPYYILRDNDSTWENTEYFDGVSVWISQDRLLDSQEYRKEKLRKLNEI